MSSNYFIQLPLSLLEDPLWKDMPPAYKEVFLTILSLCVWKPTKFDDHGKIINLKPGQLCISERELLKKCSKHITRNDIQRTLSKLFCYGFSSQEVSHKKTIITITHKDTYELILRRSDPRSQPILSQTLAIKQELDSNIDIKEKKKKRKAVAFPSNSCEIGLSTFLFQSVRKILPESKEPNFQTWAAEFDLIIRVDKKSPEEIKKYITFAHSHNFWWKNVRSPSKLRKQWDSLSAEMLKHKPTSINVEENRKMFQRLEETYISEFHICEVKSDGIAFFNKGAIPVYFLIKYDCIDFKDKVEHELKKREFYKIETSKVTPMPQITHLQAVGAV